MTANNRLPNVQGTRQSTRNSTLESSGLPGQVTIVKPSVIFPDSNTTAQNRFFINVSKEQAGKEFTVAIPIRTSEGQEYTFMINTIGIHMPNQPLGAVSAPVLNQVGALRFKVDSQPSWVSRTAEFQTEIEAFRKHRVPRDLIKGVLPPTANLEPHPNNLRRADIRTSQVLPGKLTPATVEVIPQVRQVLYWPTNQQSNRLGTPQLALSRGYTPQSLCLAVTSKEANNIGYYVVNLSTGKVESLGREDVRLLLRTTGLERSQFSVPQNPSSGLFALNQSLQTHQQERNKTHQQERDKGQDQTHLLEEDFPEEIGPS